MKLNFAYHNSSRKHMAIAILLGICFGILIIVKLIFTPVGTTVHTLYAAPMMGIVLDDSLRVVHVEPESAAAQAGVLPNDTLVSINDTQLTGDVVAVAHETLLQAAIKKELSKLTLQRNGSLMTLEIAPGSARRQPQPLTPTPVLAPYTYL